jgi:predicted  nucleic acid-binding Zn-ribbon protein
MFNQERPQNPSDPRKNALVIILTILLIIVIVLLFWQRSEHADTTALLKQEKAAIETELNSMVLGYDSLKRNNSNLNIRFEGAQSKVKELLIEIEQVKSTSFRQISKYRDEMNTLRKIMRDYVIQIDSLNQKNQRLMAENSNVKQEVTEVKTQNLSLEQEKKKLEQTVTLAATLEDVNLKASGINKKGKEQSKASKIESIKVDFTLSKNLTAKRGAKNIYLRIQRPDQLLLTKSDKDLFKFEGLKIPFSAMREVEYEGMDLPVSIYWDNSGESPLISGTYTIDLFADGNNIGTTSLVVR